MKKIIFTIFLCFFVLAAFSQIQNPVQWNYSAKKKADNLYEVILTATLPKPWHIYSQSTPKGGPVPTKISFNTNPLFSLDGSTKEAGNLKVDHDPNFGVDVKYYGDKVDFVQTVKLKANVKTNITGNIEYMVCNDKQCLPPTKKTFDIKLQ
ncbi:MAG: protein-disulfide reductase DsbD domain-containing protein [Chitinophagaceae bacterium]